MASETVLDQELRTFQDKKAALVSSSLGKFVLISGENVEVWDTYQDALQAGYDRYGVDEPFMVREVKDAESVHMVHRGSLS